MVHQLLEQLALSVARLIVFLPGADALLMVQSQTRNMEILDNFLSCSPYNPNKALLTFEGMNLQKIYEKKLVFAF